LLVCKIKNKYIDNINIKFYYYYLLSIKDILTKTFLKGTANLSLDTKNFNRMKIPIPPIHIQDKITQKIDSSNEKVKYMKLIVESMKQDVINFFDMTIQIENRKDETEWIEFGDVFDLEKGPSLRSSP